MKFALFFLGEYAAMITGSAIIVTLFLGGWHLPLPWWNHAHGFHWILVDGSLGGWRGIVGGLFNIVTFFVKVALMLLFFMWVRWTLPRFRYDQLMRLGWVFFFEIALVNIFLAAIIIAAMPK
jgi:NADH-quinone oxidoreductase subunit H